MTTNITHIAQANQTTAHNNTLLYTKSVNQTLVGEDKKIHHILDNIDFTLYENEIVAILGKSGAGKSTFLRTLSGLLPPSSGSVYHRDTLVTNPIAEISMVFQSFALLPWLTVLENVRFGLDAKGVARAESEVRALEAIRLVGLEGYKNAYTKELSGGMQQRVGFARAFVVEPEILLMDEPFSALDIATANQLRRDVIRLWQQKAINTHSIVIVTHSVEEAVQMADRIVVFDHNPGRIAFEVEIKCEHPRDIRQPHLQDKIDLVAKQLIEEVH